MKDTGYRRFLREVDERVLPRRAAENDEQYARRMNEYLNPRTISDK